MDRPSDVALAGAFLKAAGIGDLLRRRRTLGEALARPKAQKALRTGLGLGAAAGLTAGLLRDRKRGADGEESVDAGSSFGRAVRGGIGGALVAGGLHLSQDAAFKKRPWQLK